MANLEKALELKNKIESLGGSLIAVSKKFSAEDVESVYSQGVVDFGENYVAEALEKIESLKTLNLRWHFIGRVQSGNLNKLIDKFHIIHSLYKTDHLKKINERSSKTQKVLLQLQHESDGRGFGVSKEEIIEIIQEARDFDKINFGGLMFMPPADFNSKELRMAFSWAKNVFDELKNKLPASNSWDTLSMGMSADYEMALEAGSTHVRMGTAIFGSRS